LQAAGSTETTVRHYQTSQCHIQEDGKLQSGHQMNFDIGNNRMKYYGAILTNLTSEMCFWMLHNA
jgi:hypothetical protein